MSIITEQAAEAKAIDIDPLRWFIDEETKRLDQMRTNIAEKIATNWNSLTTFEVADFSEIVGMQADLAQLAKLIDLSGSGDVSDAEIAAEWGRMANRKLRHYSFVATNSSQAVNVARSYSGAFWARAADKLEWVR